ncbi:MAG: hypothetical protein R2726_02675 [Acidimicrobiales bacterium]
MIDHHHRYADDGPRTLAILGPLCADHDARKTNDGWVLVRHGRSRRLVPADHPLAAGAVRGGCVDLDEPAHAGGDEAERAAHEDGCAATSPRRDSGGCGAAGEPTGWAPLHQPHQQLDLLAG